MYVSKSIIYLGEFHALVGLSSVAVVVVVVCAIVLVATTVNVATWVIIMKKKRRKGDYDNDESNIKVHKQ